MQLIAMLTMLVDHIGIVFMEDQLWLRMIGRAAFPIYAYALVQGHRYTKSPTRYLIRLFALALLSQVPYQLALDPEGLNVVATLLMAAVVMKALDGMASDWAKVGTVVAVCAVMELFPFDYGAYGLLLVLSFRYFASERLLFIHLLLNLFYLILHGLGGMLQMLGIIPTLLLVYGPAVWKRLEGIRVRKWVWRSFYPLHLLALAAAEWAFG
ncbi:TraX family protein [Paenibacillus sp. VCA1]|uniref:TraX family protein n=1 Tax=Paenibacillus sp. VCA1 TaxID=3039148 RepID=UPI0028723DAD|nr:TraX family protein [Paenibacillus sp. VCA1]MDR9856794.1 TraX family protein [Paenibacillus sp. VCA1]